MGSLAACFRLRPKPSSKRRFSVRCGINAEKPRLFQDDLTRQGREDEQQTERKRERDSEREGIRESKREREREAKRYVTIFVSGWEHQFEFDSRYPGSTHVNPRSRVTSPWVNVIGASTGKLADRAESSRASETLSAPPSPIYPIFPSRAIRSPIFLFPSLTLSRGIW